MGERKGVGSEVGFGDWGEELGVGGCWWGRMGGWGRDGAG